MSTPESLSCFEVTLSKIEICFWISDSSFSSKTIPSSNSELFIGGAASWDCLVWFITLTPFYWLSAGDFIIEDALLLVTLKRFSCLAVLLFFTYVFNSKGSSLIMTDSGFQFLLSLLNNLFKLSLHPFWKGFPSLAYDPFRFSFVVSFL